MSMRKREKVMERKKGPWLTYPLFPPKQEPMPTSTSAATTAPRGPSFRTRPSVPGRARPSRGRAADSDRFDSGNSFQFPRLYPLRKTKGKLRERTPSMMIVQDVRMAGFSGTIIGDCGVRGCPTQGMPPLLEVVADHMLPL